ncbi:ferritin-like domain-containing protein [Pengzhenrongella phosphoraccumulans]|uniref:ferritin-like domain-containing protein n=1 Tax=Pengzhenrongella phosphoraccumulans TaxID=3114394 RepID=UPI00388D310E
MFDQKFVRTAIDRSAENALDRRRFLRAAGLAGVVGAGAVAVGASPASASDDDYEHDSPHKRPSDGAILNFALNLEYLEAEFYVRAVTGAGLADNLLDGKGKRGQVTGGRQVNFQTPAIRQYAREIAGDELAHVTFLRAALGKAAVAEPDISLDAAFAAAAAAAGFDAFANETNFLLAAFIFEDVGVTAYKGAAPLIHNKTYLEAAAGILAVEAYHAANIRTSLAAQGLATPSAMIFQTVQAISDLRDGVDNSFDDDQGIGTADAINIVPTDTNGIAFSRSPGDVLNIVYLTPDKARRGGFFPQGVNGPLNTSSALA